MRKDSAAAAPALAVTTGQIKGYRASRPIDGGPSLPLSPPDPHRRPMRPRGQRRRRPRLADVVWRSGGRTDGWAVEAPLVSVALGRSQGSRYTGQLMLTHRICLDDTVMYTLACIDMDGRKDEWKDGGRTVGRTEGRKEERTEERTEVRTFGMTDGRTKGRTE